MDKYECPSSSYPKLLENDVDENVRNPRDESSNDSVINLFVFKWENEYLPSGTSRLDFPPSPTFHSYLPLLTKQFLKSESSVIVFTAFPFSLIPICVAVRSFARLDSNTLDQTEPVTHVKGMDSAHFHHLRIPIPFAIQSLDRARRVQRYRRRFSLAEAPPRLSLCHDIAALSLCS